MKCPTCKEPMEKVDLSVLSYIDDPICDICFDCKIRIYPDTEQWEKDMDNDNALVTYRIEPIKFKVIKLKGNQDGEESL